MNKVLVIAQPAHGISEIDAATLCAVSAAGQMGGELHLLVAGEGVSAYADAAKAVQGVAQVHVAENAVYSHMLAEPVAELVVHLVEGFSHIVTAATTTGKDIAPRIAALLDTQQISDITAVQSESSFTRPIYAGNAFETVTLNDAQKVITIRPTAFDKAEATGGSAELGTVDFVASHAPTQFVSMEGGDSDKPDLASAKVVISGGRGLGSGENFDIINALADKLGAAVGASRAAVDAGYVPNDYQVGQTGKIVAPDLYIAVGISGAIQHLAGMKESKVIVAINKDENAPIFDVADYGLVADLFEAVPELTAKI